MGMYVLHSGELMHKHSHHFRWILARGLTLIGLFTAIIACIIHVIIAYFHVDHNWSTILTEAMFVLMSVTCILIGLCLAEMEIEHIHDHGDLALTNVLVSNGLLQRIDNKYPNRSGLYSSNNNNNNNNYQSMLADTGGGGGISDTTVVNSNNNNDHGSSRSSGTDTADRFDLSSDFAVLLTPPLSSFYLLISADFINLISFLLVFNYFIRQCEKARMDKRHMKSAETTTTPTTRSHA
ncbi:unnamed protein product [Schistosoma turkestanicum]|nr:unnamed protein product [Schistosoma turkestanicum]